MGIRFSGRTASPGTTHSLLDNYTRKICRLGLITRSQMWLRN